MPDDISFDPSPAVTEALTPDQGAARMQGLFGAVVKDAVDQGLWTDERPPARQRPEARQPEQDEIEDASAAASEEPAAGEGEPEESEQPADDSPQSVAVPPGLSKSEREQFLALPPEAQAAVAEWQRGQHETRSKAGREAAERQRQIDAERQAIATERNHYAQSLKGLIPALAQQLQGEFGNVDWAKLAQEDPAGWVAKRQQYDLQMSRLASAQAEASRIDAQAKADAERAHREFVAAEREKLADKLPDFRDGRKRDKLVGDLRDYLLKDVGFDQSDVDGLADSRMFLTAWKAQQWDKAQAARASAQKGGAPAPVRSGTPAPPQTRIVANARQRLAQTGRVEDAAAAFKAMKIFG